jgi:hypothetical protein
VGCLARIVAWGAGLLGMAGAIIGLVLLISGYNDSHSCTLFPTGTACRSATPHEVVGVIALVVGVLVAAAAVRSTR